MIFLSKILAYFLYNYALSRIDICTDIWKIKLIKTSANLDDQNIISLNLII